MFSGALILFLCASTFLVTGDQFARRRNHKTSIFGMVIGTLIQAATVLTAANFLDLLYDTRPLNLVIALTVGGACFIRSYNSRLARIKSMQERTPLLLAQGLDSMAPSTRVKELARTGRTIEAIVEYRHDTGASLKEAKAAVAALPSASGQ